MVDAKINKEIMNTIKTYIEKVKSIYEIEAIIIFGSYAKGLENENSDIDIAIVSKDFKDLLDDGAKLSGMTWKIDTRIEPHPIELNDYIKKDNPFIKEIIKTGIKVA